MPERPGNRDGYAILVQEDMRRHAVGDEDCVVFAVKRSLLEKLWSVLIGRPSAYKLQSQLNIGDFDFAFIGDTVLLPLVGDIPNNTHTVIRFHNLYMRHLLSGAALKGLVSRGGLKLFFLSAIMSIIELRALRSNISEFHFISKEDSDLAIRFSRASTKVCTYCFTDIKIGTPKRVRTAHRLIWYGGVQTHKIAGLIKFITQVFTPLRLKDDRFVLELYGARTEVFNDPSNAIFGHGFLEGEMLPFDGDGIFIVPDDSGIGVKIKVKGLLEKGCWFISTPEGMIGYSLSEMPHLRVAPLSKWVDAILDLTRMSGEIKDMRAE